jgi:hypothetical protein
MESKQPVAFGMFEKYSIKIVGKTERRSGRTNAQQLWLSILLTTMLGSF